jgi:uncharacterized protein involved in type VI secretion and phage assembly
MPGHGLLVGIVVDLKDPERIGRVKVSYPELGDARSDWARVVTPMAGNKRGMVFRPEPGDEVLVGFLQGDTRAPYVLGGVWNAPEPPPTDDGKPDKNNWRFITSRSGNVIRFDDTAGKEKIELIDHTSGCSVIIDRAKQRITITAGTGGIELNAGQGPITLTGETIELKAKSAVTAQGQSVKIHATTSVKADAGTTFSLSGGQSVTIKGTTVDIN